MSTGLRAGRARGYGRPARLVTAAVAASAMLWGVATMHAGASDARGDAAVVGRQATSTRTPLAPAGQDRVAATAEARGPGSGASAQAPRRGLDAAYARRCPAPAAGFITTAPGPGKTVALTFDDGPGPADAEILDVLTRERVPATFFFTGDMATRNPQLVRRVAAAGFLVADHSYDHRYPLQVGGWSTPYLTGQMTRTNTTLSDLTGQPVCFFRPPGGFTDNVLRAASAQGMSTVLWSIDTLDWRQPSRTTAAATRAIVAAATNTVGQTHPIVLMHSGKASSEPNVAGYRGNTVAALPAIIGWYRAHGYTFVDLTGTTTG